MLASGVFGLLVLITQKTINNPKDSDYKETKVWAKSQGYKPYDVEQVNKTLKTRFSIKELM